MAHFDAGDTFTERRINSGLTFYAPNAGLNTTSDWAMGNTPSDAWQPARTKAGRVAALITKDFFGGKAKTQTLFGTDFVRTDYAIIGTTLQIVGETLCEAVDLRSNQRVLDVAAGNGNASLAAARRFVAAAEAAGVRAAVNFPMASSPAVAQLTAWRAELGARVRASPCPLLGSPSRC